ncbi:MAG: hypothetical protein ABH862_00765, partial [Candidatus Omnitrophota bacterium]
MNKIKSHFYFKSISILVIIAFLSLDIAWAYPDNPASADTLAFEVMSQPQIMDPGLATYKESMISDVNILGTSLSVARYLLGDTEEGEASLPLEHMAAVIRDELGDAAENIDLTRVSLKEGIVIIPVKKDSQKFEVQIALKNSLAADDLSGYEWLVSDKYAVRIITEGKNLEKQGVPGKTKKEITVSGPVAEIDVDKALPAKVEADKDAVTKSEKPWWKPSIVTIRRIMSVVLVVLVPVITLAGQREAERELGLLGKTIVLLSAMGVFYGIGALLSWFVAIKPLKYASVRERTSFLGVLVARTLTSYSSYITLISAAATVFFWMTDYYIPGRVIASIIAFAGLNTYFVAARNLKNNGFSPFFGSRRDFGELVRKIYMVEQVKRKMVGRGKYDRFIEWIIDSAYYAYEGQLTETFDIRKYMMLQILPYMRKEKIHYLENIIVENDHIAAEDVELIGKMRVYVLRGGEVEDDYWGRVSSVSPLVRDGFMKAFYSLLFFATAGVVYVEQGVATAIIGMFAGGGIFFAIMAFTRFHIIFSHYRSMYNTGLSHDQALRYLFQEGSDEDVKAKENFYQSLNISESGDTVRELIEKKLEEYTVGDIEKASDVPLRLQYSEKYGLLKRLLIVLVSVMVEKGVNEAEIKGVLDVIMKDCVICSTAERAFEYCEEDDPGAEVASVDKQGQTGYEAWGNEIYSYHRPVLERAITVDIKTAKELIRQKIMELKALNKDRHAFKPILGIKAGLVTTVLSMASLATASSLSFSQGGITLLNGMVATVGAYFTWATLRYFSLGIKTYRALVGSGVSPKEAWYEAIARSNGYRHEVFEKLSESNQRLITLHEVTDSHFMGLIGILPINSLIIGACSNIIKDQDSRVWLYANAYSKDMFRVAKAAVCSIPDIKNIAINRIAQNDNLQDIEKALFFARRTYHDTVDDLIEVIYGKLCEIGTEEALTALRDDLAKNMYYDGVRIPGRAVKKLSSFVSEEADIEAVKRILDAYVMTENVLYRREARREANVLILNAVVGNTELLKIIFERAKKNENFAQSLEALDLLRQAELAEIKMISFAKKREKIINGFVTRTVDLHMYGSIKAEDVGGEVTRLPRETYDEVVKRLSSFVIEYMGKKENEGKVKIKVFEIINGSISVDVQEDEWTKGERIVTKPSVVIKGHHIVTADMEKMKQMIRERTEGTIEEKDDVDAAGDVSTATTAIDLIETEANNRRTRIVEAINKIVMAGDGVEVSFSELSGEESMTVVRAKAEEVLKEIWGMPETVTDALPEKTVLAVEYLEENISTLEADTIVASLMRLARAAKREGQKIIVGFETDWIPGYEKGKLQYNAVNPLVKEIGRLEKRLHLLGLDNVIFEHKKSDELAEFLLNEAENSSTKLSNI